MRPWKAGRLHRSAADTWGETVLVIAAGGGSVSCAQQDIQRHPWPLPTRCHWHPRRCDNPECFQPLPDVPWEAVR